MRWHGRQIKRWKIVTFYPAGPRRRRRSSSFLFPLYFGFAKLGLINNVFAVSLVYTAIYSPCADHAGCTPISRPSRARSRRRPWSTAPRTGRSSWRVMLPIVSPGILTVALIIGLYSWNEFLIATTFLQRQDRLTAVVSFFLLSASTARTGVRSWPRR